MTSEGATRSSDARDEAMPVSLSKVLRGALPDPLFMRIAPTREAALEVRDRISGTLRDAG
jgi:hypothetical protein